MHCQLEMDGELRPIVVSATEVLPAEGGRGVGERESEASVQRFHGEERDLPLALQRPLALIHQALLHEGENVSMCIQGREKERAKEREPTSSMCSTTLPRRGARHLLRRVSAPRHAVSQRETSACAKLGTTVRSIPFLSASRDSSEDSTMVGVSCRASMQTVWCRLAPPGAGRSSARPLLVPRPGGGCGGLAVPVVPPVSLPPLHRES